MDDFIARLPKAELHVHVEGTVEPETLWRLAQRHNSPLLSQGKQAVQKLYATTNFGDFLQAFKTVCEHLRSPEDYELITYEALRRLALQNVRYAEITLSAGVILWKQENLHAAFDGAEAGLRRAREEFGIRAAWIFDAVRQFGPEAAFDVARSAARLHDRGVVGFGIGGDERQAPAELFRKVFAYARSEGLHVTAHAGETSGPQSVWSSLHALGVERIGHGLTAAQDLSLVRHLAEKQIPLEVCLSSNLRTACIEELAQHPLRRYFDAGILVTLNTDDPALFGTDLNREYLLAQQTFAFTHRELRQLTEFSFRSAFLPEQDKQTYLASLQLLEPLAP